MRGVIYKYTSPSGKVYIGQTLNEYMRKFMWKNVNHPYAGPYINRARTKYGYCETSAIKATNVGHLFSVVDDDKDLENGMIVKLGAFVTGEDEIRECSAPLIGSKVVLICQPAITYDQSTTEAQQEYYFKIDAGTPARTFELVKNDRFAVIDALIAPLSEEDGVQVGNYVVSNQSEGEDSMKYAEIASDGDVSAYGFVTKVLKKIEKSNMTTFLLRVERNVTLTAVPVNTECVVTFNITGAEDGVLL